MNPSQPFGLITWNLPVTVRRHIKPAVVQGVEQPVSAAIVLRQPAGHGEDERLQLQREIDPEQIGGDAGTLILGNQLPGMMLYR